MIIIIWQNMKYDTASHDLAYLVDCSLIKNYYSFTAAEAREECVGNKLVRREDKIGVVSFFSSYFTFFPTKEYRDDDDMWWW